MAAHYSILVLTQTTKYLDFHEYYVSQVAPRDIQVYRLTPPTSLLFAMNDVIAKLTLLLRQAR